MRYTRIINTKIVSHVSQIPAKFTNAWATMRAKGWFEWQGGEDWFKLTTFLVQFANGGNKIRDFIILEVHWNGAGGGGRDSFTSEGVRRRTRTEDTGSSSLLPFLRPPSTYFFSSVLCFSFFPFLSALFCFSARNTTQLPARMARRSHQLPQFL